MIPVTGEIGEWTELSADLEGATGTKDVYFTYTGASGDLFELDAWAFTEGAAQPSLDVTAEAATRCAAGKVQVTVKVTKNDDVAVQVAAVSEYGTKTFASVAPGKSATHAYTTRTTSIASGDVDVTASATVDGQPVSTLVSAPYDSRSCG